MAKIALDVKFWQDRPADGMRRSTHRTAMDLTADCHKAVARDTTRFEKAISIHYPTMGAAGGATLPARTISSS
jgi:hypothetical protein